MQTTRLHQGEGREEEEQGGEVMLNAASINSDSPAKEIPKSYLRIINSNTAGIADRELQHQMSELGLLDANLSHGLATSLYMGDIMWNTQTTPSNF
jgi:hypothetical protein